MTKLIGYARVSTRQQFTDRQEVDFMAADVQVGRMLPFTRDGNSQNRAGYIGTERTADHELSRAVTFSEAL